MKAFRRAVLVAFVLVSAVVVVASPAFATPNLTTSTGTRPDGGAVSPFATPLGDTLTSSITISVTFAAGRGLSTGVRALDRRTPITVTCIRVTASAHILTTHTRISLPSFNIDGCRRDEDATTSINVLFSGVNSSTPLRIHFTSNSSTTQANEVIEIPPGAGLSSSIRTAGDPTRTICEITVNPQSVRAAITTAARARVLDIRDPTIRFSLSNLAGGSACPDPGLTASLSSLTPIAFTTDTPATNIIFTAAS